MNFVGIIGIALFALVFIISNDIVKLVLISVAFITIGVYGVLSKNYNLLIFALLTLLTFTPLVIQLYRRR